MYRLKYVKYHITFFEIFSDQMIIGIPTTFIKSASLLYLSGGADRSQCI